MKTNERSLNENLLSKQIQAKQYSESSLEEQEGGLNLPRLLGSIRRQWLIVSVFTLAVSTVTFFWSVTRAPTYRGEFKILVEPVTAESEVVASATGESSKIVDQDLGDTQVSKVKVDYETQFQVLLSRNLLEPVVSNLETQFPISYETLQRRLKLSRLSKESKIIQISYESASVTESEAVLDLVSKTYMNYSLTERQTNVRRALDFAENQLTGLNIKVNQLEKDLQEFRERNAITDPQSYGEQLELRIVELQNRLGNTQIQLSQNKSLLVSLQKQNRSGANSAEAGSVLSDSPEYQQLQRQLQEIETKIAFESEVLTPQHPKVIELINQREKLLPLIEKSAENIIGSTLYDQVDNPESLPYQNSLRQGLVKQLVDTELAIQSLESEKQSITFILEDLKRKQSQLPNIRRQYEYLQRQLQIEADNLQNFMKTRSTLMLNATRQESPWELIDPPTIQKVIFASIPRDISLGVILGFLLGCGVAIFLDEANKTIHTLDELRSSTRLPILGLVPVNSSENRMIFHRESRSSFMQMDEGFLELEKTVQNQNSPFMESFRSLNVQLRMLEIDNPIRSLVISSSLPNEGKSTVAINLAKAAAALGQKVLLVDADFRKPRIHERLSLQQMPGLSEMLALDVSIESAVKQVPMIKNLSVLTAGSMLAEHGLFLGSQKMQALMGELEDNYDLVIYDTPPLGLSDAMLICPYTRGLLFVARLGTVDRDNLQEAFLRLQNSQTNIIGVVANCVANSRSTYSYDYYNA